MVKKLSLIEFKKLVKEYNEFFEKMVSNPFKSKYNINPIYEREDLTPEQKDAIALTSDGERIKSYWPA